MGVYIYTYSSTFMHGLARDPTCPPPPSIYLSIYLTIYLSI